MIYRLDEDQQSEEYDSRIPSRQGCNSRRSGTFISDDEDDNDKGRKLYYRKVSSSRPVYYWICEQFWGATNCKAM